MGVDGYRVMHQVLLLVFIVEAISADPLRGSIQGNRQREGDQKPELSQTRDGQNGCAPTKGPIPGITCEGPGVTEIPLNLPTNMTRITFENTGVSSIPEGAFEMYPTLEGIIFKQGSLNNISTGAFRGLPDLHYLSLSDNELSDRSFGLEPFEGLSSLILLVLDDNSLTSFPLHLFANAKGLKTFQIESNQISDMEPEVDFLLNNLTRFLLAGNELTTLNTSIFQQMPKINDISFANNQISVIHNGSAFMDMQYLEHLSINHNPLHCDCQALWMVEARAAKKTWAMKWDINLPDEYKIYPECGTPKWMAGEKIAHLYRQDLTCEPPMITPITSTHLNHTFNTPLILQATLERGFPYSTWVFPDGRTQKETSRNTWNGGVTDEVKDSDHSVMTTLKVDNMFDMSGLVNFTLIATNVAGESNITFWVYTDPSELTTGPTTTSESTTVPTTSETTPIPTTSETTPGPMTSDTTPVPTTSETTPGPMISETTPGPMTTETSPPPAGGAVGGPSICTGILLLMLICTRIFTG